VKELSMELNENTFFSPFFKFQVIISLILINEFDDF